MHSRGAEHARVVDVDLPDGLRAFVDFDTRTIYVDARLTAAERRAALVHESIHLERGPAPAWREAAEEDAVDRETARRLVPLAAIADALRWTRDVAELADELDVPVDVVECRLRFCDGAERARLDRAVSDGAA